MSIKLNKISKKLKNFTKKVFTLRNLKNWLIVLIIFSAIFAIINKFNNNYAKAIPLIGDEPSYMAIADSLTTFKTFNLYQEQKTEHYVGKFFYHFDLHMVNVAPGQAYPKHGLAWPILFSPFFYLANNPRLLIMALQNVIVSLLAVNLFLWLKENKYSFWLALFIPGVLIFALPIAVQAHMIFSEPLAALFTIYGLRKWDKPNVFSVLGIAILPWVHIKYLAFYPLFIYPYFKFDFRHLLKTKIVKIWPLIIIGASVIGLAIFNHYAYGTIFSGQEKSSSFFNSYQGLLGILINREDGLLTSAPIYLLSFLGLGALFFKNRKTFYQVVYCVGVLWFITGIFESWSGGQGPSGRMILVTLPILAPALAEVMVLPFKWIFRGIFALLWVPTLILAVNGIWRPVTTINKPLYPNLNIIPQLMGWKFDLEKYFPDVHKLGWNLNLMWLLIFIGLFILGLVLAKYRKQAEKIYEAIDYNSGL